MFDVGHIFISELFMCPEDGTLCLVTLKSGTNPWVTVGSTQTTTNPDGGSEKVLRGEGHFSLEGRGMVTGSLSFFLFVRWR